MVAGQPVEIRIASVSASTVRVTVLPIDDGRLVTNARDRFATVNAGDLRVRFTAEPPTVHIDGPKGVSIQRLQLDATSSRLAFSMGRGPLLGFGEGGPQFDRTGSVYTNRNGQGGYQLRTHGGRVPIQWLVSTDGWDLYLHRPLGAFDLAGTEGIVTPTAKALPIDAFVTASPDPSGHHARVSRSLSLSLVPGSRMRPPATRVFDVRIAGASSARRLEFAGKPVQLQPEQPSPLASTSARGSAAR